MADLQNPTYTEQEHDLVRRAALGALALVSQAEPGFFDAFRESMAGSKALAQAPAALQELFKGGFVLPPKASSKAERDELMLADVRDAVQIVEAKSPEQADAYRQVLLSAAEKVAGAADGVSPEEQAMIEDLKAHLGESHSAATGGGQTPSDPARSAPSDPAAGDPDA